MPIRRSPVIAAQPRRMPGFVSLQYVDVDRLGGLAAPVLVLDDFRVREIPFSPHSHAGFAAVTYVLEDSLGGLRSRTSLGNDIVVGPGGIVWTQAGRGIIHEEAPADTDRELHGLQIFVNLSSKNKVAQPQVFQLDGSDVPEWRSDAGDRIRVVVGSFDGVVSPLVPPEAFFLLDVELRREIPFALDDGHNALIYVLRGQLVARADGADETVVGGHCLALHASGESVTFKIGGEAHFVLLSGAEIREPVMAASRTTSTRDR
ncbi:MAG TPA: pirin family protein [Candidatus Sulfotelmatobacter sp.]|nr:pirin family protein [Candidatus Sulfotelmatobacter sp.]